MYFNILFYWDKREHVNMYMFHDFIHHLEVLSSIVIANIHMLQHEILEKISYGEIKPWKNLEKVTIASQNLSFTLVNLVQLTPP